MFKRVTFHLSPADCADHLKAQLENYLRHGLSYRYFNIHEGKDLQFFCFKWSRKQNDIYRFINSWTILQKGNGDSVQCIVTKGGSRALHRTGYPYLAELADYTAVCARLGDSNIREHYLSSCSSYSYMCLDYTMYCLLDAMKPMMQHVCNGGDYTLMTTTGNWSYRGYSGSIASVDDDRDGECIAMCNT